MSLQSDDKRLGEEELAPEGAGRLRILKAGMVAVSLFVFVFIAGVTIFELVTERAEILRNAEREARTLSISLAENTGDAVTAADLAILYLATTVGKAPSLKGEERRALGDILVTVLDRAPALGSMAVIDAEGHSVMDTLGVASHPGNFTDRAYFQVHRDNPDAGLYIGEPIVGRVSKNAIIPMSRRIEGPNGEFAGVVLATLGPSYFKVLYAALDIGPESAILLAHRGGMVIARHPSNNSVGTSFAQRPLFSRYLREADAGVYTSPPQSDGQIRIVGYQRVEGLDLVVAVAVNRAAILAPWERDAVLHLAGLLVLALAGGGCLVWLLRLLRLEERSSTALAENAAALARRARQQRAVATLSQTAGEENDSTAFLSLATTLVCEALRVEYAVIGQFIHSRGRMLLVAGHGLAEAEAGWYLVPDGPDSHAGYCLTVGVPVLSPDYRSEGRFRPAPLLLDRGARSGLAVPIALADRVYGVLGAHSREADAFGPDDIPFLESIASVISTYFERQRDNHLREAVMNGVSAYMCVIDSAGRVLMVNEGWKAFAAANGLGIDTDWRRMNYLDVCAISARPGSSGAQEMEQAIRGALAGRRDIDPIEYPCHSATGQRWFRTLVSPLRIDRGYGAVVMHLDITRQHQIEEQLRETQRLEALGHLTGGVAHDFNNMLTVIMGNADQLYDGFEDGDARKSMVDALRRAARRGADLTDRLLSYARRQTLFPQALPPDALLDEFASLLHRTLREDIHVEVDVAPGMEPAFADPGQLHTALLNLVFNARDALPNGGTITVSAKIVDGGEVHPDDDAGPFSGRFVAMSVRDNGTGMARDVRERVFEPFFTTKPVGAGTGLGLSMVHGFARQSGGTVRLESEPGRGTEVTIYLPVATEDAAPARIADAAYGARTGHGFRILVVEDEDLVRDYLVGVLETLGFAVSTCRSGTEAISAFDPEAPPDLVLTDVIMPGALSGYDLAGRLRELAPALPIILMTGYTSPHLLEGLSGFDSAIPVLQKPFSVVELVRLIEATVSAQPGV